MGPPLGHVRDPQKQTRFVEAELTALLQAAGGTLPVIKKNEKGVFVIVEAGAAEGAPKPAPAPKPAAPAPKAEAIKAAAPAASKPAAPSAAAPAAKGHRLGENPNRQLFRRSTYAGVVDTGPVPGETFEQKVERLKKVSAGAKQRAEEGGGEVQTLHDSSAEADTHRPAAEAQAETGSAAPLSPAAATASPVAGAEKPSDLGPDAPASHKPTGQADRGLMKRSTYCGVTDTGPVPGETFEQKVARLAKLSAAAKQRAEGG